MLLTGDSKNYTQITSIYGFHRQIISNGRFLLFRAYCWK